MYFISAYYWEQGGRKINQDSLTVQCVTTRKGPLYMACICDGIGGLSRGETASGFIVEELTRWFYQEVIPMKQKGKLAALIRKSFYRNCYGIHEKLKEYGEVSHGKMGSTCTCLILTKKEYFIFHIGDTCVYKIGRKSKKMTEDHRVDGHILVKCIGTGTWSKPDFSKGHYGKCESFFLCSDGYCNQISEKNRMDILKDMNHRRLKERELKKSLEEIGKRNRKKGEQDNMSAVYVRLA